MSHIMTSSRQRILAGLIAIACAFGLMLHASPSADAMTTTEKKAYMQALAAQEKLSYDVLTDLAALHDSSFLALMARAEQRDLQRVREMLRIHGWKDRTSGDAAGYFRNYPLVEQAYFDMIVDGQDSVADSARVGIALQQMSLAMIYELLGTKLTKFDHQQLRYAKSYASNRMIAYRAQINALG